MRERIQVEKLAAAQQRFEAAKSEVMPVLEKVVAHWPKFYEDTGCWDFWRAGTKEDRSIDLPIVVQNETAEYVEVGDFTTVATIDDGVLSDLEIVYKDGRREEFPGCRLLFLNSYEHYEPKMQNKLVTAMARYIKQYPEMLKDK